MNLFSKNMFELSPASHQFTDQIPAASIVKPVDLDTVEISQSSTEKPLVT